MTLPVLEYLDLIQKRLQEEGLDGWLLYDFRAINPVMLQLLDIPKEKKLTRRLYVWIPAKGLPTLIRHHVEHSSVALQEEIFSELDASCVRLYSKHRALAQHLDDLLIGCKKVAMEVSPCGRLPYLSCVDMGTIESVQSRGVEVVSSASLVAQIMGRWKLEDLVSHLRAARALEEEVGSIWKWTHAALSSGRSISEYQIQQHLKKNLQDRGMIFEGDPIVAIEAASADPHYCPTVESHQILGLNQVLLVDVWCRENRPLSRFADICRMAYSGSSIPSRQKEVFNAVQKSQQAVFDRLEASSKNLRGCDLDKVARDVIIKAGFEDYFIHRLGHSIDLQCHGSGTHLDDYETCDDRPIVSRTCFSVEPGIYFHGDFGVRLESDVYIDDNYRAHITGGLQKEWVLINPQEAAPNVNFTSPLTLNL